MRTNNHASSPSLLQCFANVHLTPQEYGVYCVIGALSYDSGVFYMDNETLAGCFTGRRPRVFSDLVTSLYRKGWLRMVKPSARNKFGIPTPCQYAVVKHDEWLESHSDKTCRKPPADSAHTDASGCKHATANAAGCIGPMQQGASSIAAGCIYLTKENPSILPNERAGIVQFDATAPATLDSLVPPDSGSTVERNPVPAYPFSRAAGTANPAIQPVGGVEGKNPFVKKDDVDDEPEPIDAATRRRIQKSYAMSKDKEWRKFSKEWREQVTALIRKCQMEWEYRGTHDADDDLIDEEDRTLPVFPVPTTTHKLKLAQILQTYTERQVVRAFKTFVNRPEGFDGLNYSPWYLFIGDNQNEFDFYVKDDAISKEPPAPQPPTLSPTVPPLPAFVKVFHAEEVSDGWLARCPLHIDSNPSLIISQTADGKVLVRCRGGCNQADVWRAAVEKARTVPADELPTLGLPRIKTPKEFIATQAVVVTAHALLHKVPEVQKWLNDWAITAEVADKLQLGANTDLYFPKKLKGYSAAVCIPHYDILGKTLIGAKARAVPVKDFTQENGSDIDGLFAAHLLDPKVNDVLIFEGEKDVAIAMSHGFNATGILCAQSKLSDADLALLSKYKNVYVIGDQDDAGTRAMNRLVDQLITAGVRGVARIYLPDVKDVGELFAKHRSDFKNQLTDLLSGVLAAA